MKILYIGYHGEGSDWGTLTKNNILALDAAGLDVACRSVALEGSAPLIGKINQLESKSTDGCDVCIQHVFPNSLIGSTKFKKNIAILSNSFVDLTHTTTIEYLKQVDEVWVSNEDHKKNIENDLNVRVVPNPCDTEKFKQRYQDIQIPQGAGKFKFYAFLNSKDMTSIDTVFSCFHAEFDYSDRVTLVVVISDPSEQSRDKMNHASSEIKSGLGLNKDNANYIKEVIITDNSLSEEHLLAAHQYGNCFLDFSNTPWPNHAVNAMGLGSKVILINSGGGKDLLTNFPDCGHAVGYSLKCDKTLGGFLDLGLGTDFTCVPDQGDVRKAMRSEYEKWLTNPVSFEKSTKTNGVLACDLLSLKNVGSKMKEMLSND